MAGNTNLNRAGQAKNDEFYTQLADIEKELRHYKEHFKGKTVLCNCDDPYESNFFKYFAMNFNYLGLKKLIATCYVTSPVMYTQLSLFDDMEYQIQAPKNPNKKPYKVEITEVTDENSDGAFDLEDIKHLLKNKKNVCSVLKGDGDFRSEECIELLKEADIVVTNPPFSLARTFISTLFEYSQNFLIVGDLNWITYKEVFSLMQNNKVWLGYTSPKEFIQPNGTTKKFGNKLWFTNLDIEKRHEDLILFKPYIPEEYPKYDNYDAIEVNKTANIPCDYAGVMGVPITFLDKYNPSQFEIIMLANGNARTNNSKETLDSVGYIENKSDKGGLGLIDGKLVYARLLIRRKEQAT